MSISLSINVESKKKLIYILTKIYGLGLFSSKKNCEGLGYDLNNKNNELSKSDLNQISSLINLKYKFIVDTDLKKKIMINWN